MNIFSKETLRNDRGSMPFAILVAGVSLVISTLIGSAVAWQAKAVYNEQSIQDAHWAATSAINMGLEQLSVIDPESNPDFIGVPVTTSETDPPADLEWMQTPTDGVQLRWWVQKTSTKTNIILHAQGRAGKVSPAQDTSAVDLTYDYARAAWVTTAVRGTTTINTE